MTLVNIDFPLFLQDGHVFCTYSCPKENNDSALDLSSSSQTSSKDEN